MRRNTHDDVRRKLRERSAVADATGCREWQGPLSPYGYAHIRFDRKWEMAHRAAYALEIGPIPEGMHVLHRCDNRRCINASHLFLGTNHDNILDKAKKGRAGKKLTTQAVSEIKGMIAQGITQRAIAAQFGIDASCVSDIKTGQSWRLAEAC